MGSHQEKDAAYDTRATEATVTAARHQARDDSGVRTGGYGVRPTEQNRADASRTFDEVMLRARALARRESTVSAVLDQNAHGAREPGSEADRDPDRGRDRGATPRDRWPCAQPWENLRDRSVSPAFEDGGRNRMWLPPPGMPPLLPTLPTPLGSPARMGLSVWRP